MRELPELPDPNDDWSKWEHYTADQMTAYARQAVAAAMERAAQIAEGCMWGAKDTRAQIASAIRAEMSKEEGK